MFEIDYPEKKSEAEIEALLWYFLRKKKIDARLQVRATGPARKSGHSSHCQLDIVIFKDKKAVCIVECKSWTHSYASVQLYRKNNTIQLKRYAELYGIPVLLLGRNEDITKIQDEIIKLLDFTIC